MVTGTTAVISQPTTVTNMTSERIIESTTPVRKASDNRRSNKPIMEKRRRARINNCLNELKTLILDAMKKDPARHSKLEKADILEMTVKHLENLQRQQVAMSAATDPAVLNKFRAGFSECAGEVGRFPGLDPTVKRRLLQHLANCLTGASQPKTQNLDTSTPTTTTTPACATNAPQPQTQSVQVHILPSTTTTTLETQNGFIFSNTGVQLVPTRLANGDIALILPTTTQQQTVFRPQQQQQPQQPHQNSPVSSLNSANSPLPMLVPIPTRTASTASASSSASSVLSYDQVSSSSSAPVGISRNEPYSAPSSPEPMDLKSVFSPPAQKPLSLVIRKSYEPIEEDKPWRPW